MNEQLDEATVRRVAHLARLTLTDDEVQSFRAQLSAILDYMRQLNELDTSAVPPMAHPLPVSNVFREDEVRTSWTADEALHNAPSRHGDFFLVPRVLEQETV